MGNFWKRVVLAGAVSAGLLANAGFAQRIVEREKNQQNRIAGGVKSGELTKKETLKLEKKEAQLHREIRKDRRDGGGLTPKERAKIEHKQDKLSQKIYKEKHDNQTRK